MCLQRIVQKLRNIFNRNGKIWLTKEENYALRMGRLLEKYDEIPLENNPLEMGTFRRLRKTLERMRNSFKGKKH